MLTHASEVGCTEKHRDTETFFGFASRFRSAADEENKNFGLSVFVPVKQHNLKTSLQ